MNAMYWMIPVALLILSVAIAVVLVKKGMKPLSIAVEEMYKGEVTILPESEVEAEEETKEEPVIE